jgi:hypothetical protein
VRQFAEIGPAIDQVEIDADRVEGRAELGGEVAQRPGFGGRRGDVRVVGDAEQAEVERLERLRVAVEMPVLGGVAAMDHLQQPRPAAEDEELVIHGYAAAGPLRNSSTRMRRGMAR